MPLRRCLRFAKRCLVFLVATYFVFVFRGLTSVHQDTLEVQFDDYNARDVEQPNFNSDKRHPPNEVLLTTKIVQRVATPKQTGTHGARVSTDASGRSIHHTTDDARARYVVEDLAGNDPGRIWYDEKYPWDDRIMAQLRYKPPSDYLSKAKVKTILVPSHFLQDKPTGQEYFIRDKCSVSKCSLTGDITQRRTADVVLDRGVASRSVRNRDQIKILFQLESPHHSFMRSRPHDYNWTATYRRDSTIVAPYEKFVLYHNTITSKPQERNYAQHKTKKVAWFVSNCAAKNNRLEFAKQLQQHISVDIYGHCGNLSCTKHTKEETCFKMLTRDYKFYLAFENSNCKDYITEKLYWNAFLNDVIPVVMGARPSDYKQAAPYHSVIHVEDFNTVEELAGYLNYLDKNDDEYNSYFEWKDTGEFINTKFLCRVCAMAHAADAEKHVESLDNSYAWWKGANICAKGKWWNESRYN